MYLDTTSSHACFKGKIESGNEFDLVKFRSTCHQADAFKQTDVEIQDLPIVLQRNASVLSAATARVL